MTIELVPLATARLQLGAPRALPQGPRGTRLIVEVISADWDGERLKARQPGGPAGDWALVSPDGALQIDVRSTLETHDGALVYVSYTGRAAQTAEGTGPIYITPVFETADPRYLWLNKLQAVGRGIADRATGTIVYDIRELR